MPNHPSLDPRTFSDNAARYTHRVAISNDRVLDIEDEKVRFRWKDYRESRQKTMTLPSRPEELHLGPLTDPDLTLSRHPARATA
jgi:hypothetical protein